MSEQIVWIARHGNRLDFVNPEWFNTAKRRYDPPLSEDGWVQAKELANRLKGERIEHIFSSPFLRTIQTAYCVAQTLNLPIKLEAGLSEWFNPDWMSEAPEIHPEEFLAQQYPSIDWNYQSLVIPQYPENETTVNQRTAITARKLVAAFSKNILLIGHGASVVGTAKGLMGENVIINASLCCLVKLVCENQTWRMPLNGDISHLSQPQGVIQFQ